MKKNTVSFCVRSTGQGLALNFYMDACNIGNHEPTAQWQDFTFDLPEQDGSHVFEVELYGKTPQHTVLDEHGCILQDVVLEFKNWRFDNIDLEHAATELIVYEHDFNGTGSPSKERFFGTMGCNGRLKLNFETPIFSWLLMHLL